jgi:hypothetical protein
MGKVVATYNVHVTIREPDTEQPASVQGLATPTVDELTEEIEQGLRRLIEPLEVNAIAERTDR